MNSLQKGEGVPLLNFVGGLGVPLLNFEGGPGVPLLNFEGVLDPRFQGPEIPGSGSLGPGPTFTPYRMKLLVHITSKNWFTPVFCLYLIRFKLKPPSIKLLLFPRRILSSNFSLKSLLNLRCCMLGYLDIVPNTKLGFLGIRSSMKTDSSSLGLCICKTSCTLYDNFCDIYVSDLPADDSIGVCSIAWNVHVIC